MPAVSTSLCGRSSYTRVSLEGKLPPYERRTVTLTVQHPLAGWTAQVGQSTLFLIFWISRTPSCEYFAILHFVTKAKGTFYYERVVTYLRGSKHRWKTQSWMISPKRAISSPWHGFRHTHYKLLAWKNSCTGCGRWRPHTGRDVELPFYSYATALQLSLARDSCAGSQQGQPSIQPQ